MNDGVLVSRQWLEKVNLTLFGTSADVDVAIKHRSLFYEIRPAYITTSWSQVGSTSTYTAKANFIINGDVEISKVIDVFCVSTPPTVSRVYIAWRGRWEVVGGSGGSSGDAIQRDEVTTQSFLTSASLSGGSVSLAATGTSSAQVLSDVIVSNGALVLTFKFIEFTSPTVSTQSADGLKFVSNS